MSGRASLAHGAGGDLDQRHRELCEFVALISHDLRTPLTAIRGYAQLLQRQAREEAFAPLRPSLAMIMEQADRLAGYTELLLDVARIQTGRVALQRGTVDLAEVAREAARSVTPPAQVEPLQAAASALVEADAKRTLQIVKAMLQFAAERTPVGHAPRLVVTAEDGAVSIEAQAPGPELPEAERERLLDRLVQISDDGQRRSLAHVPLVVAAGLAEAHGGALDVCSTPDAGTSIRLRLPRHAVGARTEDRVLRTE